MSGVTYGHMAARWRATGKGARKRGGGQWVRARGSAVADNGYGREAVQWRVTSTGATQRGGGRRVRERGSARQSGRGRRVRARGSAVAGDGCRVADRWRIGVPWWRRWVASVPVGCGGLPVATKTRITAVAHHNKIPFRDASCPKLCGYLLYILN